MILSDRSRVGFVGLGRAGSLMAGSVRAARYELVVSDADPARESAFASEHGCAVAAGPRDFAGSELVITMLPDGDVVREVLLGADGGLAAHLPDGAIVVDTSSADPLHTRRLGAELLERGITLLDAPVTRPEHDFVDARNITIMVAGDDDAAIDAVWPVLEAMAHRVFRAGGLGCGHAMKTLNNFVAASGLVAALDAMMVGRRFGLDVETMLDVFNVGTARNFSTASVLLDESMSRRYGTGFQLALLVKDLGIAQGLVDEVGFDTPLLDQVRGELVHALGMLDDPRADHSVAVEAWERRADVELPPLRAARKKG